MVGGLHNVPDVKILILYILDYAGCVLSKNNLTDIVQADGLVSYFDFSQSIEELLSTGLIDIESFERQDRYRITKSGKQTLDQFVNTLPFNVRKKNSAALLQVLAKIERDKQISAAVIELDHGYEVICGLNDGEDMLLQYKLLVPDLLTANMIVEQFKENPTEKYKALLKQLVDDKLFM